MKKTKNEEGREKAIKEVLGYGDIMALNSIANFSGFSHLSLSTVGVGLDVIRKILKIEETNKTEEIKSLKHLIAQQEEKIKDLKDRVGYLKNIEKELNDFLDRGTEKKDSLEPAMPF